MNFKRIHIPLFALTIIAIMLISSNGSYYKPSSTRPSSNPPPGSVSATVIATVTVGGNPDSVAYDSRNGYIYVASYGSNTLSVISGSTLITTLSGGGETDGVAYDTNNGLIYVANHFSPMYVFNGTTQVASIYLGTYPRGVTYDSGNGYIYVTNEGSGTVSVVNGTTVVATVGVGASPWAAAYDSGNGFVYVANAFSGSVSVINGTTVIATVPVGQEPIGVGYDAGNGYVYVSNGYVYSPNPTSTTMSVINGTTVVATISGFDHPGAVAYDSGNGFMYVPNYLTNTTSLISGTTIVATVAVGTGPYGVGYDPANGYVYVTNLAAGTVSVISTTVTAPFDYALSNNGPLQVVQGSSGTISITATLTAGTAQPITISCVNATLAAGITCNSFTPDTLTPTSTGVSSALTINSATSIAPGNYSFQVTSVPQGATTIPTTVKLTVLSKCSACPAGLVSWWPLEGNARDIVSGNSGTIVGSGGQFVPGEVGLGFESGGPGSAVAVTDTPSLDPTQLTLDSWVKINSLTVSNMPIAGKVDANGFLVSYGLGVFGNPGVLNFPPGSIVSGVPASGKAIFSITDGTTWDVLISNSTLSVGNFVHLAGSTDGSTMRLYVNGQLDAQASQVVALATSPAPFVIGSAVGTTMTGFYFNGIIDEVDLYNRALIPSEVQSIFNAAGSGKCPCAPRPSGMVNWWTAEGNGIDIAGGNNGTLINGAGFASGMTGQAFSLNGVNQYVQAVNPVPFGSNDFSVDLWANFNSPPGSMVFVSDDNGGGCTEKWWFGVGGGAGPGGALNFHINTSTCSGLGYFAQYPFTPNLHQWYNFAVTRNAGNITMYVDGVKVSSQLTSSASNPTVALTIGSAEGGNFFNGLIDEVQIYNIALNASEIQSIHDAGGAGVCRCAPAPSGLVSWWPGDGNANDIVSGNSGTFVNGATFASGEVGEAFKFNGNNYVVDSAAQNIPTSGSISFSAWIKYNSTDPMGVNPEVVTVGGFPFCSDGGIHGILLVGKTGVAIARGCNITPNFDCIVPGAGVGDNNWHYIATVWNGTSSSVYIDGLLRNQCAGTDYTRSRYVVSIGGRAEDPINSPYNGLTDEVQIFNRALTSAEVLSIFKAGSFGLCRPGVQLSPFDFNISASPSDETVLSGGMARYQLSLGPVSGTPQPVTLSVVAGLPSGATFSFSSTTVTPSGFSNLTITTTAGTVGDFNITIAGSGPASHTITVKLHIYDFTVDSSLCQQTVLRGSIAPFNLTFTLVPGSSVVNLPPIRIDAIGLPFNTTVVITSPPGGAVVQSVTLSKTPVTVEVLFVTHANTPLGDFGFGISLVDNRTPEGGSRQIADCIGGFQIHTFNFTVGFSCAVSVTGTTSGFVNVTLTPGSSTVNLPPVGIRYSGLPTGSLVQSQSGFPPFTVPCGFSIPHNFTGIFSLGVSGIFRPGSVGGFGVGAAPPGGQPGQFLVLHIYDFQVIVAPVETVMRGGTGNYTATVQLLAGSSVVNLPNIFLNVSGLPPGILASLHPNNGTAGGFTSILTLQTFSNTPLGDFVFNVTGCDIRPLLGGCRVGTGVLHIYDFTIKSSPSSSTVTVGGSAVFNETLTLVAGSSTTGLPEIHLNAMGLPAGTVATFSLANVEPSLSGNTTKLTIVTGSAGTFNLTIIGSDTRTPEGGSRNSLPLSPQTLIVLTNTPTITTVVSPSTISISSTTQVDDNATLSGGFQPTGTLTFKAYFNSPTCSADSLVFTSSGIAVSGDGNYLSTPGFTASKPGTYQWVAIYSGDSNNNGFTTACGAKGETLLVSLSQITDSSFCPIANNQFTINYRTLGYELVSTNPGQFYDNVFYTGTPGTQATLVVGIPFPFVTQGSTPIQVSSNYQTSGGCFQPSLDATGQFSITATGGTLSPSHSPILILGDYGTLQIGSNVYVTVSGTVPSTGLIYLIIHLNYGLRTQSFYRITSGTGSGTSSGIQCTPASPCAQWTANPAVIICSQEPYIFTVTGALTISYQTKSVNNFPSVTTHYVIV